MAMNCREFQAAVLFTVLCLLPAVQTFVYKVALIEINNETEDLISLMEQNELNCNQSQTIECLNNTSNNNDGCDLIVTFLKFFDQVSHYKINKVSVPLKRIRQLMKDFGYTCNGTTAGDTCGFTKTDGDYQKFCKVLKGLQTFKERLHNYLM